MSAANPAPFEEIGTGFYNLRSSFTFLCGMLDIGTHMSLARLNNGRYLVIDTCNVSPAVKAAIDRITNNGDLIEGVIATHPFHTMYFPAFYKLYPNAKYYGTPRHIRNQPSIPWAGNISEDSLLSRWKSEGIYMKIPAGAEFINPEESNHFSAVMVFHKQSRTIHTDDTIMIFNDKNCLLNCLKGRGTMEFWDLKKGLYPTTEAPLQFKAFIEQVIAEWDFDNICAAHTGNTVGGAKHLLQRTLTAAIPQLDTLSRRGKK